MMNQMHLYSRIIALALPCYHDLEILLEALIYRPCTLGANRRRSCRLSDGLSKKGDSWKLFLLFSCAAEVSCQ